MRSAKDQARRELALHTNKTPGMTQPDPEILRESRSGAAKLPSKPIQRCPTGKAGTRPRPGSRRRRCDSSLTARTAVRPGSSYHCRMADPQPKATVNLRPLRLRAMMTQEELALKSGVGTRTVRDIESGKVRPQPRTLRLLIKALELDEADQAMLAGAPNEPAAGDLEPMTLPSGTAAFTGRSASLARLDEAADAASSPLVILSGTGGVGKTMLALHWGHRASDRFPGGRFYLDLHGFAPGAKAMEPAEAVRHLLGAMGVGPQRLPAEAAAQLALYRTLIGS